MHQAVFVGEDDCLHPVAQLEFGEHPSDVGLDGRLGKAKLKGDLKVGQAEGDLAEHLAFAVGQPGQPRVRVVPLLVG